MRLVQDDDVIETLLEPITARRTDCFQELAGADTTSAMPMDATRRWKAAP